MPRIYILNRGRSFRPWITWGRDGERKCIRITSTYYIMLTSHFFNRRVNFQLRHQEPLHSDNNEFESPERTSNMDVSRPREIFLYNKYSGHLTVAEHECVVTKADARVSMACSRSNPPLTQTQHSICLQGLILNFLTFYLVHVLI